ncbi:REP-associated tyrosine transposase [Balneola vulgaris]|uniref:REP-associated tyrosine transposase n=1 Tax=Balneola vulgaris TaxID=287535 RepID=UPI00146143B2|nr:transposase [Balneola vulgaris]
MEVLPNKKLMGRSRFKFHEDHYPYFITYTVVGGVPIFDDPILSKVIIDSLKFMTAEFEIVLYSYVIMHNHIHMIVESNSIAEKIRRVKSFTARKIIDSLEFRNRSNILYRIKLFRVTFKESSQYQFWQEGSHPIQINNDKKLISCIEYIHNNPVKAGFVEKPEHWLYSSARAYKGLETDPICTLYGLR